ncbi:MAG: HTH-type transcriptional regulator CysB [Gammaproteobacteria bacterium]|nr:HTH-type transcriptional regulator CysB [Gammaproteobacteria bacterium]
MKLQQLRYLCAIVKNNLNVTAAAGRLYTSQPGISKQIRLLEDELGVQLFERSGKQLTDITTAGRAIIDRAECALVTIESIRQLACEFSNPQSGSLSIATTHTQARYVLPPVIRAFRQNYSGVGLEMHQGNPEQISEMAASGVVDFAIATEAMEYFEDLVMMPCYHWNRAIITPCGHPLMEMETPTLDSVVQYPILTYVFGLTGRSNLDMAFKSKNLTANVVFTATDADVIKTYVRLGLGVGIVAKMAYDSRIDTDLCAIDASHLFEPSTTKIGFRRGMFLRGYHYDFIRLFSSHLTRDVVDAVVKAGSNEAREDPFDKVVLQVY